MIRDTFRVYRNHKLKAFFDQYPDEHDQGLLHALLAFIKTEFPECEEALRGELIHEEKS